MKNILNAYNNLIQEIKTLQKSTDNPFFHSKYTELNDILDEVKDKIISNGFALIQYPTGNKLVSKLLWVETGETFIECELDLINASDMQKLGSAITYARRYSLLPLLQMQCEDDDGNTATGNDNKEKTLDDFINEIKSAKSVKQISALWYQWKDIYAKDSEEYTRLTNISTACKKQLM